MHSSCGDGSQNQWLSEWIVPDGETTFARTDFYYNSSWQVLEERKATGVAAGSKDTPAANAKFQYVWDICYIDAPVLRNGDTVASVSSTVAIRCYEGVSHDIRR